MKMKKKIKLTTYLHRELLKIGETENMLYRILGL